MKRLSALLLGLLASCGTPEFVGAQSAPEKLVNAIKPPAALMDVAAPVDALAIGSLD